MSTSTPGTTTSGQDHSLNRPYNNINGDNSNCSEGGASLLDLPAELIHHILGFLLPSHLAQVAQTCRQLQHQSYDCQIWLNFVNHNLHTPITDPTPCKTFRELYHAHHPNWFLTRHQIWFADSEPYGKVIICRYDARRGCIEGYALVATRGKHDIEFWENDREVVIHSFDPHITLDLNQPVLKLDVDSRKTDDQSNIYPNDPPYTPNPSMYSKETLMDIFAEDGLYGSYLLCRRLPERAIHESASLWPPLRFPSQSRVRNTTRDGFTSTGHRPTELSEVSQHHFRLRKWVEYSGRRSMTSFGANPGLPAALIGMAGPYFSQDLSSVGGGGMSIRMPEDIKTYATLPRESYIPTKRKPWQGIWCGDYSGHGCEFLVITQPDKQHERPLPEGMGWLRQWFNGGRRGSAATTSSSGSTTASYSSALEELDQQHNPTGPLQQLHQDIPYDGHDIDDAPHRSHGIDEAIAAHDDDQEHDAASSQALADDSPSSEPSHPPSGRLEAIKLTGDPNIPRGEYTFIAPDIGPKGFMRVCDESIFYGARVVRSAGHIAGRGFRQDQYTPSQLIMISHDRLAQFWEGFGHISFYQRVDLDALMKL
ncbi:hypothetical protein K431DRAFT_310547 [Polychaeton citri CBS 116435]|uniref:F-box domain-containing protein n=1 Tax=Polychaeton citri CBS 116435 TaxID=1314669 RepID=A0A9P4QF84_9PEZI|nr:hypothetical protein K431DRAFT_310547 [Polychaeton citri CBS 116435]